jgi:DNA-binding CsgD family transcriptional regulator
MRVESSRPANRATPEFPGIPSLNALDQMTARAAPQAFGLKWVPNAVASMPRANGSLSHQSTAGFLLIDPSLSPISFNDEALQILSYPSKLASIRQPGIFLAGKIRCSLIRQQPSRELHFVTEFRSGHRRYLCHAFVVDSQAQGRFCPRIAILLERDLCPSLALSTVCEQLRVTQREREALEHLLRGLSSKEIANRMNVSTNTVKTFLRLLMSKMGVSSRTALVARITTARTT